uniref:ATP synthase F0 subunit 8 n=1 Tax=Pseudoniphargus sp. 1-Murcia TaxID=2212667 RepID=A0A345UE57_9CRUS|nr:ATP synthase F0 subunit 8 [Pseudoniphargus sp. 1-Murcia]
MPQMAPMLWSSLFCALFSLICLLMSFLFFTWVPQEKDSMPYLQSITNLYWKW